MSQTTSLVLGVDSSRKEEDPSHAPGSVVYSQDAIKNTHQGKIEVYGFKVDVAIPTQRESPSYLLHKIFSGEERILISPTGGTAVEYFYKPIGKLVKDSPTGSGCYMGDGNGDYRFKSTQEETKRFWMLNDSNFIKELVAQGWMNFPKKEEMTNYEKEQIMEDNSYQMFKRELKLSDLSRALKLTDTEGKYTSGLEDLADAMKYVDDVIYVGSGIGIVGQVEYKKHVFNLRLDNIEQMGQPENPRLPKDIQRKVYASLDFRGSAPKLNGRIINRIEKLAREYAESRNFISSIGTSKDMESLKICVYNRNDYGKTTNPLNTQQVLDQAVEMGDIVRKLIAAEHEQIKNSEDTTIQARRKLIGLPEK